MRVRGPGLAVQGSRTGVRCRTLVQDQDSDASELPQPTEQRQDHDGRARSTGPVAKTRARSVAENEALLLEGAAVVFGVLVGVLDLPEAIVRGGSIGMAMASAMGARAEAKRMALATTTSS